MSSAGSRSLMQAWFETPLWKRIVAALILGVIVGVIWGEGAQSIRWLGDLFIRGIQMVVVPLVFVTIVSGIVALDDPRRLGSLGVKTFSMYMLTTLIAITFGLILAAWIQPGAGVDLSGAVPGALQEPVSFRDQLLRIVPTNPFAALAAGDFLAVIFFAIIFGIGILSIGEKGKPLKDLMDSSSEVMLKLITWVMETAPFGVFALIAWVSGTQGVSALLDVIPLAGTAVTAFILHFFLIYGGLMRVVLGLSPWHFFRNAKNATLVAFSTSSSSATLPVTLATAEKNLGISPVVASTTLPLGATINMDGSAIYVGVVSVFAAQVFGVDLSLLDYMIMAGATTLVSVGTAAVPGASVFLMAGVMSTIGLTPAQIALVVGFILPFDRPLDMMRTCLNVTGDLAVSTAVAKWEGELDVDVFRRGRRLEDVDSASSQP